MWNCKCEDNKWAILLLTHSRGLKLIRFRFIQLITLHNYVSCLLLWVSRLLRSNLRKNVLLVSECSAQKLLAHLMWMCLRRLKVMRCVLQHNSQNNLNGNLWKCYAVWIIITLFCPQTGSCEARGFVHSVVRSSLQSEASEEQQPLSQQPAPQSCQFRCDYFLCCDAECE